MGVLDPILSDPETQQGDHDRMTHIVLEGWVSDELPNGFAAVQASVVEGTITGTPVKALCGKIWVPGRPIAKFSICPTCKEVAKSKGWSYS